MTLRRYSTNLGREGVSQSAALLKNEQTPCEDCERSLPTLPLDAKALWL